MTPISKSVASSGLLKPIKGMLRNCLFLPCTWHGICPGPSMRTPRKIHPGSPALSMSEPESESEEGPSSKRSKQVVCAYWSCLNDWLTAHSFCSPIQYLRSYHRSKTPTPLKKNFRNINTQRETFVCIGATLMIDRRLIHLTSIYRWIRWRPRWWCDWSRRCPHVGP